ncbi:MULTISPECIES: SDR family NAD(P)-dependent oxidoreductase [unclassified Cyanobium]|jgi:NAD(P)-dependent dehydrogenase (short-subunit alcohol dehydrogenase family)|uniref:SDR family NAD(P)-dependent oxidoreductase n=1 Tax=unclassified Cyanobium TaxID=2627006 RepID=UPI0016441FD2|nr:MULTISPECIES: SDR family NAD(P)-dependent oxidoreductase [unclassified Cyanobium]MBE9153484.1 SDR family NAD(P)-dependent oxidoreductase [Cyanobium sp. LEGE 06113]QNI70452.1 short chain dehydrogenase family protein [Cyanobium sp. NS01]
MARADSVFRSWCGRALVVGCGGIGQALLRELARRAPALELLGASRRDFRTAEPAVAWLPLDVTCDHSLQQLGESLAEGPPLRLVLNSTGLLHDTELQPEKRLSQVSRSTLERSFAVNAFAPILLAQAIEPFLPKQEPFHLASLSARVGSIGDNGLGGWYGYRAAKAAQNQLLHTLALEWRRRLPLGCVSLLHPGTTATALSGPFQANVPPERLFSPERAAGHLLDVLEGLGPEQSGRFWAWDGAPIPW